ncbi:MAG: Ig-like domain-containing protein [Nitrospirae bacterium]|nr:Ig-like domain-containing protein [Nitrospirota bacterium]
MTGKAKRLLTHYIGLGLAVLLALGWARLGEAATIASYDFESDNGGFTPTNDWEWGTPTFGPASCHGGSNCWATQIDTRYSADTTSILTSPPTPYDFSPYANVYLSFWFWRGIEEGFDGLRLRVTSDGGLTWRNLDNTLVFTSLDPGGKLGLAYDGLIADGNAAWFGFDSEWVAVSADLSAFAGQPSVQFQFYFDSDATNQAAGAYIDDVTLYSKVSSITLASANPAVVMKQELGWLDMIVTHSSGEAPIKEVTVWMDSPCNSADGGVNSNGIVPYPLSIPPAGWVTAGYSIDDSIYPAGSRWGTRFQATGSNSLAVGANMTIRLAVIGFPETDPAPGACGYVPAALPLRLFDATYSLSKASGDRFINITTNNSAFELASLLVVPWVKSSIAPDPDTGDTIPTRLHTEWQINNLSLTDHFAQIVNPPTIVKGTAGQQYLLPAPTYGPFYSRDPASILWTNLNSTEATALQTDSVTGYKNNDGRLRVDDELIDYVSITNNASPPDTFNTLSRGAGATTAVSHSVGTILYNTNDTYKYIQPGGFAHVNFVYTIGGTPGYFELEDCAEGKLIAPPTAGLPCGDDHPFSSPLVRTREIQVANIGVEAIVTKDIVVDGEAIDIQLRVKNNDTISYGDVVPTLQLTADSTAASSCGAPSPATLQSLTPGSVSIFNYSCTINGTQEQTYQYQGYVSYTTPAPGNTSATKGTSLKGRVRLFSLTMKDAADGDIYVPTGTTPVTLNFTVFHGGPEQINRFRLWWDPAKMRPESASTGTLPAGWTNNELYCNMVGFTSNNNTPLQPGNNYNFSITFQDGVSTCDASTKAVPRTRTDLRIIFTQQLFNKQGVKNARVWVTGGFFIVSGFKLSLLPTTPGGTCPDCLNADGQSTYVITVEAKDAGDNPEPGLPVEWASDNGTIVQSTCVTDGLGKCIVNLIAPISIGSGTVTSTVTACYRDGCTTGTKQFNKVTGIVTNYIGGTLAPTTVSAGSKPSYTMNVRNNGNIAYTLSTASTMSFTDGTNSSTATLSTCSGDCILGDAEVETLTFVTGTTITTGFCNGSFTPVLTLEGTGPDDYNGGDPDTNPDPVTQQPTVSDKITVTGGASCAGGLPTYVSGTIFPASQSATGPWAPSMSIKNVGVKAMTVKDQIAGPFYTEVTLTDLNGYGTHTYTTRVPVATSVDLGAGGQPSDTASFSFNTNTAALGAVFCNGPAKVTLRVVGNDIDLATVNSTPIVDDTVTVVDGDPNCSFATVEYVAATLDTTPLDGCCTNTLAAGTVPQVALEVKNTGNDAMTIKDNPLGNFSKLTVNGYKCLLSSCTPSQTVPASYAMEYRQVTTTLAAGGGQARISPFVEPSSVTLTTDFCSGTASVSLNIIGTEQTDGDAVNQTPSVGDTVVVTGGKNCNASANNPPNTPTSLAQKDGSGSIIPDAGTTAQTTIKFSGTVSDPDNNTVMLQVEVVTTGSSFANSPTYSSPLVASGTTVSITATIADGNYKWQARTVDVEGASSSWVEYEEGASEELDFMVDTVNPDATGLTAAEAGACDVGPGPGDTVTVLFNGSTNGAYGCGSINTELALSNGHTWGTVSCAWSTGSLANDTLTITITGGSPTVAVGDTITIAPNTIEDASGNDAVGSPPSITGTFDSTLPTDGVILSALASDDSGNGAGAQAGDAVTLTFDKGTNGWGAGTPCPGNLDANLTLSASHTWGSSPSCAWSSVGLLTNNRLKITLGTSPTVTVNDSITISACSIQVGLNPVKGSPPNIGGDLGSKITTLAVAGAAQTAAYNVWSFCTSTDSNYDDPDLSTFLGSFVSSREGAAGSGDKIYVVKFDASGFRATYSLPDLSASCGGGNCGDLVGPPWHWTEDYATTCSATEKEAIFFGTTAGYVFRLDFTGTGFGASPPAWTFKSDSEIKGGEARNFDEITTAVTGDGELLFFGARQGLSQFMCSLCWFDLAGATTCDGVTPPRLYDCVAHTPAAAHLPNTDFSGTVWVSGTDAMGVSTFKADASSFSKPGPNYAVDGAGPGYTVFGFPYRTFFNRFYVGTYKDSSTGALHVFNNDASFSAAYPAWAPAGTGYTSGVGGIRNFAPWIAYGGIFVGDETGKLHCLKDDATGGTCGAGYPLQSESSAIRSQPIVLTGVLYLAHANGKVYAYDITFPGTTLRSSPIQLTGKGYPYALGQTLDGNIVVSYDGQRLVVVGASDTVWYLPVWTSDPSP